MVPVIGHADTWAAPGSRTHELACALGFGTVNANLLRHQPRKAAKDCSSAKDRSALLRNKYTTDWTGLEGYSRDDGTVVVNVVLVDDSSSLGCTCDEIARTLKAKPPPGCIIKVWVVVFAHWIHGAAALNSHLSEGTKCRVV